jgi:hypothetical protein
MISQISRRKLGERHNLGPPNLSETSPTFQHFKENNANEIVRN